MLSLDNKVYEIVKTIPFGKVSTYQDIAIKLGNKNLARSVGNSLHRNHDFKSIHCYKVVNSRGMLSFSYAFGGIEEQKRLLTSEGILIKKNCVDLKIYRAKL